MKPTRILLADAAGVLGETVLNLPQVVRNLSLGPCTVRSAGPAGQSGDQMRVGKNGSGCSSTRSKQAVAGSSTQTSRGGDSPGSFISQVRTRASLGIGEGLPSP